MVEFLGGRARVMPGEWKLAIESGEPEIQELLELHKDAPPQFPGEPLSMWYDYSQQSVGQQQSGIQRRRSYWNKTTAVEQLYVKYDEGCRCMKMQILTLSIAVYC